MRVTDFANELFGADAIPERGAELGREVDSAWLGAGAEAPLNADEILDHIAVMLRPDRNPTHEAQVSNQPPGSEQACLRLWIREA